MVYFICNVQTRSIKIGVSADPRSRLHQLQIGSADELSLIFTVQGGRALEAELHWRLAKHRLRGEWFADGPAFRAEVRAVLAARSAKAQPRRASSVWEECQRRGKCRYGLKDVDVRPYGSDQIIAVRSSTWDRESRLALYLADGTLRLAADCELIGDWPISCHCGKCRGLKGRARRAAKR